MSKGSRGGAVSRVARFLLAHGPILILLALLAVFVAGTFGNYVASDDLSWVTRTISDSTRPLHIFSANEPLFGNYYRPMAHLAWLINYYIWGFNFDGHQAMFVLLWLTIVWLTYQVGLRMGGRLAGLIAAALVGFNDIYLMMSGWKSWYTSLVELAALLAWAVFYLDWLKSRSQGKLIAWVVCAGAAVLSRELAPLVISASILATLVLPALLGKDGGWKRRTALAAAWLLITGFVLIALPSYRESLKGLMGGGGGGGLSWANVAERFRTHSGSMLFNGISRYLLYLAALLPALGHLRRWAGQVAPRRGHVTLIGALAIGCVLLAAVANASVLGKDAWQFVSMFLLPAAHGLLLALVVLIALTGDRDDRMLGFWFPAAFLPILVLPHGSNAYHMAALVALALFAGKRIAPLVQECWSHVTDSGPQKEGKESWYVLSAALLLIFAGQVLMLVDNVGRGWKKVRIDSRMGRAMREMVDRTVAVTAFSLRERKAFVGDDPYSVLAGQMLQSYYGVDVTPLNRPGSRMVGLRLYDVPLRVYSHAIAYDDETFRKCNYLLRWTDSSFENMPLSEAVVEGGRTGNRAMAISTQSAQGLSAQLPSGQFSLPPGPYVFGGFVRVEAESAEWVTMDMVEQSADTDALVVRTQPAGQQQPQWELLWEDMAVTDQRNFVFHVLDVHGLKKGRAMVDDIFLCPTTALISELQRKAEPPPVTPEVTEPPGDEKPETAAPTPAVQ